MVARERRQKRGSDGRLWILYERCSWLVRQRPTIQTDLLAVLFGTIATVDFETFYSARLLVSSG